MSTATLTEPRIASVNVTDEAIIARLADGRIVSVPLEWSWRLKDATPEQRGHWEIIGDGQGVHWPDVDEDLSIEGMMRGVPARRPSRKEMRILLDASSLIDLEHGNPLSFADINRILRESHARLVLTYTNVLEFAGPFEKNRDRYALHEQLQQVERLPLGYFREVAIKRMELAEAIAAFKENREFAPLNPFVRRWDETVPAERPSPMRMLVGQGLYDLVVSVLEAAGGSPLTLTKGIYDEPLRMQFGNDRKLPPKDRRDAGGHFRKTIVRHLEEHGIEFPADRVNELADWIYANPAVRCPGYRVAWEMRRELANNITQAVSGNDMFDHANALALPYVDAVTMDRNTAARCGSVVRRLKEQNPAINYDERIFTSLKELLNAKF